MGTLLLKFFFPSCGYLCGCVFIFGGMAIRRRELCSLIGLRLSALVMVKKMSLLNHQLRFSVVLEKKKRAPEQGALRTRKNKVYASLRSRESIA